MNAAKRCWRQSLHVWPIVLYAADASIVACASPMVPRRDQVKEIAPAVEAELFLS